MLCIAVINNLLLLYVMLIFLWFRTRRYYEPVTQSTVSKISSGLGRIRGALRTNQPIEGAVCIPETQTFENGGIEELIVSDCSNSYRDLSAWRVSVPNTELVQVKKMYVKHFFS